MQFACNMFCRHSFCNTVTKVLTFPPGTLLRLLRLLSLWKAPRLDSSSLSPLSFMIRTRIVLLCLPAVPLHALTRFLVRPSNMHLLALFLSLTFTMENSSEGSHEDRESSSHDIVFTRHSEKSPDLPRDIWQFRMTFTR